MLAQSLTLLLTQGWARDPSAQSVRLLSPAAETGSRGHGDTSRPRDLPRVSLQVLQRGLLHLQVQGTEDEHREVMSCHQREHRREGGERARDPENPVLLSSPTLSSSEVPRASMPCSV